jgi:hypothetical protein
LCDSSLSQSSAIEPVREAQGLRISQWGARLVLILALTTAATTGVLYFISMRGLNKVFGPVSPGATIAVYGTFAIVALADLVGVAASFFLGIVLLLTSGRKNPSALFCALSACVLSAATVLFWLFYCGGIPGTSQRPFP